MSDYIAPYILREEFYCRHCHQLPPDVKGPGQYPDCYAELFAYFKTLREAWGRAIPITSGYRCPTQNELVGGEDMSVHIFGLALDLGFTTVDEVLAFKNLVKSRVPQLRLGWRRYLDLGQTIVHIDVGYLISPRYSKNLVQGAEW